MLRPRRLRSRVPASHQNRASASIWSPQNPESMPQDSLTHAQLGIPDSTSPESALAKRRHRQLNAEKAANAFLTQLRLAQGDESQAGEEQARQELGDIYQLIDVGEPAT